MYCCVISILFLFTFGINRLIKCLIVFIAFGSISMTTAVPKIIIRWTTYSNRLQNLVFVAEALRELCYLSFFQDSNSKNSLNQLTCSL